MNEEKSNTSYSAQKWPHSKEGKSERKKAAADHGPAGLGLVDLRTSSRCTVWKWRWGQTEGEREDEGIQSLQMALSERHKGSPLTLSRHVHLDIMRYSG